MGNQVLSNIPSETSYSKHRKRVHHPHLKPSLSAPTKHKHWYHKRSCSKSLTNITISDAKLTITLSSVTLPTNSTKLNTTPSNTLSTTSTPNNNNTNNQRIKPYLSPISISATPISTISEDNEFKSCTVTPINTYVSARAVQIASDFWHKHITPKTLNSKLELACSVYFNMMISNKSMKTLLKQFLLTNIESLSLKLLDMLGWLIRSLTGSNVNDIDLVLILTKLGQLHKQRGVMINHYYIMLQSFNDTFSFYYPIRYNIEVKYAINQIFMFAARIMTGMNTKNNKITLSNCDFLQSLKICLESAVGKEYLFRYLQSTLCDEIVIFYQYLMLFKSQISDKERFMTARAILKNNIGETSTFCINIGAEHRQNIIVKMKELEIIFLEDSDNLIIPTHFFEDVEAEINKLVADNHWALFHKKMSKQQIILN